MTRLFKVIEILLIYVFVHGVQQMYFNLLGCSGHTTIKNKNNLPSVHDNHNFFYAFFLFFICPLINFVRESVILFN